MTYEHTQRSPIPFLTGAVGLVLFALLPRILGDGEPLVAVAIVIAAAGMVVASFSFARLTVREEGDRLAVRFGPLPLASTSVRYAEVRSFRRTRSSLIDGFGIHWLPRRGWIWNLWGFDCVQLEVAGRRKPLRIGTDDPEGLTAHLAKRTELDPAGL